MKTRLAMGLVLAWCGVQFLGPEPAMAYTAVDTSGSAALPPSLGDLSSMVDRVRKQFQVPGISVAIVKDGQLVLAQGYGVRSLDTSKPVDGDTLFAIASNTKAFTATALQMLAEQGKLNMDGRVTDYLPGFQMSDPYVTHEMRIRDLLAHRSGLSLGAGDLLYWPPTRYSAQQVVEHLRNVPLSSSFRAHYAYDNILFDVATLVIEKVSGQSYADFVRQRILLPAGMDHTVVHDHPMASMPDVATGHALADFTHLQTVPEMTWANNLGAGSLYSSARDLARWMNILLAGGALPSGRHLFSTASRDQMWTMLTPIPVPAASVPQLAAATPNFLGYGEGFFLSDYQGQRLVWHTGGWPGMVSRITLVPGMNLGIAVLTNQESGAAFNAITMTILDAYMGRPKTDWTSAYAAAVAKANGGADQDVARHKAARAVHAPPSLPPSGYAGIYHDRWYGDVIVSEVAGKLRLSFSHTPLLTGTLEPWQHDSFVVHWDDRSLNADAFVDFSLDEDGKVVSARMHPVSARTDFSFDFQDLQLLRQKDGSP
ncbi:serine hydrolase [Frateuria aurantia]